jgi:cysteine desulfurase
MKKAYLDYAATAPLHPDVLEAMMPYFREEFGNPLSVYDLGMSARAALETARASVADLINAKPGTVIFTSSGAEANNFALKGIALARQSQGKHIIISKVEHHSILNTARSLEKMGFVVTYLPVDNHGLVDPETFRNAITKETILASVTHASREIGTIEPIRELAAFAREKNVTFHTDAIGSTGAIPVDVQELGVDLLSMTAHQFQGPKGVGALYVRDGLRIVPLIYGGIQEGGRRAGTENVAGIVGMGKAAAMAKAGLGDHMARMRMLRDRVIEGALALPRVYLTGHPDNRLPHHASFVAEYIEGEAMLLLLAMKGIYAASGSACSSRALKSSPVLLSLGVSTALAQGSIVFTLGAGTTSEDVDHLLAEFPAVIKGDKCYVGG